MSAETKYKIEQAGAWITRIILGVIVFFMVRLVNQFDLNNAEVKMELQELNSNVHEIKTDVEVLKVKTNRIESDIREINSKIEEK